MERRTRPYLGWLPPRHPCRSPVTHRDSELDLQYRDMSVYPTTLGRSHTHLRDGHQGSWGSYGSFSRRTPSPPRFVHRQEHSDSATQDPSRRGRTISHNSHTRDSRPYRKDRHVSRQDDDEGGGLVLGRVVSSSVGFRGSPTAPRTPAPRPHGPRPYIGIGPPGLRLRHSTPKRTLSQRETGSTSSGTGFPRWPCHCCCRRSFGGRGPWASRYTHGSTGAGLRGSDPADGRRGACSRRSGSDPADG